VKQVDSLEVIEEWIEDGITIKRLGMTESTYEKRKEFYMKMTVVPRTLGIPEPIPFPAAFTEQYLYSKEDKRISLMKVEGLDWKWELYPLEGKVKINDSIDGKIEGYQTRKEAHERIKQLLA
jgi:hypothetical protein